jgi:integrase
MCSTSSRKYPKPYPDFPLTPHPNGQWCKKIRGRIHYFGRWGDWEAALRLYLDQKDDLHAGRRPHIEGEMTVGMALNHFLSSKKRLEQAGELTPRSYRDYVKTCDRLEASLRKDRPLTDIGTADLEKLRSDLYSGQRMLIVSPATAKGDLCRARMIFLYINENRLCEPAILYRKSLKSPPAREFRRLANERGPRMFKREEIKAMLGAAHPQLAAMIYLGINCGFGNDDCGTLTFDRLDLENGWHNFWRPKTHNPRRCPLWPETIEAIRKAQACRPKNVLSEAEGLVFVTRLGGCWFNHDTGDNAISSEIRKLLKGLGMYRKSVTTFYTLRRTFETVGQMSTEQTAVNYIMGHIAATSDMAAVYRQKTYDSQLRKVTDHVRGWFNGQINID